MHIEQQEKKRQEKEGNGNRNGKGKGKEREGKEPKGKGRGRKGNNRKTGLQVSLRLSDESCPREREREWVPVGWLMGSQTWERERGLNQEKVLVDSFACNYNSN